MLCANTGFAVPEKILNRSSFTTLALRVATQQPHPLTCNRTGKIFHNRNRREETLRQNPRDAGRLVCGAHQTSEPVARDTLADEGLLVRKPNSGSARHRWARENTKHRRTATRQRGFCSSSLEQLPLDSVNPGIAPENPCFEIV